MTARAKIYASAVRRILSNKLKKTEELSMHKKMPTALMLIVGLIAVISIRIAAADSAIDFTSYTQCGS